MQRDELLGLSAVLNVIASTLAVSGHRPAANGVYRAIVEIDRAEAWTAAELRWMGAIQNDLISALLQSQRDVL